jgi:predicted O-methyltransferase YrrM
LEIDPKLIATALAAFEKYGITDRVKLIEGPAAETLKGLHGQFDIIFIDADKVGYKTYFDLILKEGLLSKDGIILTDNGTFPLPLPTFRLGAANLPIPTVLPPSLTLVLLRGLVVDKSQANSFHDEQWREQNGDAMKEFNDHVAKDPRVEVVVLPLFDGVGLIRLKD